MPTHLELVLESNAESAEFAETRVMAIARRVGYNERQRHKIGLAVRWPVATQRTTEMAVTRQRRRASEGFGPRHLSGEGLKG